MLFILVSVIQVVLIWIGIVNSVGPCHQETQMVFHISLIREFVGQAKVDVEAFAIFDKDIAYR